MADEERQVVEGDEQATEEISLRDQIELSFDEDEQQQQAEQPSPEQRARDERGRFAPKGEEAARPQEPAGKAPAQGKGAAETAQPQAKPAAAAEQSVEQQPAKAPASWNPNERAHWEKLPPEAREAVMRREVETNRALQESATARRGVEAMQEVVAPYLNNIRAANGGDVIGAIRTFFDYDNRLRHGSPVEKAKAVASLIKGYGVDIDTLDRELVGEAHTPENAARTSMTEMERRIQESIARQMAPFQQYISAQSKVEQDRAGRDIENFARDPKNEHFDDVRLLMADMIDIKEARREPWTLGEIYEAACWQTPEVRSKLLASMNQQSATNRAQATQAAKRASVSVRSTPRPAAPASAPGEGSIRDAVAAAFDQHQANE